MHFMSDPSERLRQARKLAGFKTMREAAEAHGLDYPTYAGHENGHRGFSHQAVRYATLFRVNLIWLMTGRGSPKSKSPNNPIADLIEAIPPEKQAQAIEYLSFLATLKN